MTQGVSTIFDRSISLGQLILSMIIVTSTLGSYVLWVNVQVTMHGYRLDKVEYSQSNGNKEVLDRMTELARSQDSIKEDIALIKQGDNYRDGSIKIILDRIEKFTK
jgi:hypothetical protein